MAVERFVPAAQEDGPAMFQVGDDQIILGCEIPVETDLRDPSFPDDLLDADGMDALPVEEVGRDREDLVAGGPRLCPAVRSFC